MDAKTKASAYMDELESTSTQVSVEDKRRGQLSAATIAVAAERQAPVRPSSV